MPLTSTFSPFSPKVNSENGLSLASIKELRLSLVFSFNCLWQTFVWNVRLLIIRRTVQYSISELFDNGIIICLKFPESIRIKVSGNKNCLQQLTDLNIFYAYVSSVPESIKHKCTAQTPKTKFHNNHKTLQCACIYVLHLKYLSHQI